MAGTLYKDHIELEEIGATLDAPAAGKNLIYPKPDGKWYSKNSAGVETELFMDLSIQDESGGVNLTGVQTLHVPQKAVELVSAGVARLNVIPRADARKVMWLNAENGGYQYTGMAAFTSNGTLAVSADADTLFTQNTSAAVTINTAYGLISASALVQTGYEPTFITVMKAGASIAQVRYQFGLFSAAPSLTSDTINPTMSAFWRFSTLAADANWQLVTSNASGQTVTDTGVVVTAGVTYILRTRISAGGATIIGDIATGIGGTFSAPVTITTNVPTVTTALSVYLRHVNAAAATKIHRLARFYMEHN